MKNAEVEQPAARYEGWANYETWAVYVNMTTPQNALYWQDRARSLADIDELAGELKDDYTGNTPLTEPGVYTDLLDGALTTVDWAELAGWLMDNM